MNETIKMYRLKVSLIGYHKQPINKLHRVIDVSENANFHALHEFIFDVFDRTDPHLYQFILTREAVKENEVLGCKEIVEMPSEGLQDAFSFDRLEREKKVHNAFEFTIADANVPEKGCFYYWFDFGDDWMHRIRVEKIYTTKLDFDPDEVYTIELKKKVGISPPQYDEHSIWEGDSSEAEFERVMAGLMIILEAPKNEVITWEKLDALGSAELLFENEMIEQPKSKAEAIKMTDKGKFFAEMYKSAMEGKKPWEK